MLANTSTIEKKKRRSFMGGLLSLEMIADGWFGGRGAEEQSHVGNLLTLLDNDRFREPPEPFIVSVFQKHNGHIDRALMVRDHHPGEIAVEIAGRRDGHGFVHARVDLIHLG